MAEEREVPNPIAGAECSKPETSLKRGVESDYSTCADLRKKQKTETASPSPVPSFPSAASAEETKKKAVTSDWNGQKITIDGGNGIGEEEELEEKEKKKGVFEIEADAAENKGSRPAMEDTWVVLPDVDLDSPGKLRCAYFAVFDGHGGRLAAEYAQRNLHKNVLSAGLPRELLDVKAAKKAILDGFRKTDVSLIQESASVDASEVQQLSTGELCLRLFTSISNEIKNFLQRGWQDGATAVCVWVLGKTVFVANIGDAKAVLARSCAGETKGIIPLKAIVLTRDHKAIYPQERARIQKAGGSVSSNGRVQGRLEVSRAFGDRQFKKVGVVATPDIQSFDITDREQFIILGCDGLWGVFGPSDAVEFVQKLLKEGLTVAAVSRRLVREAVLERHCKDNCTAIVIVFRHS